MNPLNPQRNQQETFPLKDNLDLIIELKKGVPDPAASVGRTVSTAGKVASATGRSAASGSRAAGSTIKNFKEGLSAGGKLATASQALTPKPDEEEPARSTRASVTRRSSTSYAKSSVIERSLPSIVKHGSKNRASVRPMEKPKRRDLYRRDPSKLKKISQNPVLTALQGEINDKMEQDKDNEKLLGKESKASGYPEASVGGFKSMSDYKIMEGDERLTGVFSNLYDRSRGHLKLDKSLSELFKSDDRYTKKLARDMHEVQDPTEVEQELYDRDVENQIKSDDILEHEHIEEFKGSDTPTPLAYKAVELLNDIEKADGEEAPKDIPAMRFARVKATAREKAGRVHNALHTDKDLKAATSHAKDFHMGFLHTKGDKESQGQQRWKNAAIKKMSGASPKWKATAFLISKYNQGYAKPPKS